MPTAAPRQTMWPAATRDDTVLISAMYANNETGMIQPIAAIGAVAKEKGVAFHVDAVQAFGYLPVRPLEEGIDMLTICSHKIYGPKGVGALYIRHGLKVTAEAYGGPQERSPAGRHGKRRRYRRFRRGGCPFGNRTRRPGQGGSGLDRHRL